MIALLLLIAAAAPQANPAHPAAKPATAKPVATKPTAKKPVAAATPKPTVVRLSTAGQEVLHKYIDQPDADFVALAGELRETGEKVQHLGDAPEFDMASLEQLLRKQEELQAAMRKRSDDRLLAMLGEMTPEDRLIFARAKVGAPEASKAAAPR